MEVNWNMKDRLKRILIVGAGGVLGGLFLGILCRQHFSIVGVSLIGSFVGSGFGIGSELTRKRSELIRVVVRTLSCVGLLYVIYQIFYFFQHLSYYLPALMEDMGLFIGGLAAGIFMTYPIFILVAFGVSIGEGVSKDQNVLIRILTGFVSGAIFCGLGGLILSFYYGFIYNTPGASWSDIYRPFLYGGSLALGLIIGVIISEKIGE